MACTASRRRWPWRRSSAGWCCSDGRRESRWRSTYSDILPAVRNGTIEQAPSYRRRDDRRRSTLEGRAAGLLLGRHLPARGRRARARAVSRQAVAAHAHSAEQGHLRRRGEHEGNDHRRRRGRRSALSRVQPRDAIGNRRADHARRQPCSARSTSTATRRRRSGRRSRPARRRRRPAREEVRGR